MIEFDIYSNGTWNKAGSLKLLGSSQDGTLGQCLLQYDHHYAFEHLNQLGHHALSVLHPVNFSLTKTTNWPSFCLDLMPSGAARRVWEKRLDIKNTKEFDWLLLSKGALNPIGNIRLSGAKDHLLYNEPHEGFSLEEIVNKNEGFIEFAQERGMPVSGTTGAAGDAPKFLLTKSKTGKWH